MSELDPVETVKCACGNTAAHRSSTGDLCCICYVEAGNPPADWHRVCRLTHEAMQWRAVQRGVRQAGEELLPTAGQLLRKYLA
jgi:hypothetical protein